MSISEDNLKKFNALAKNAAKNPLSPLSDEELEFIMYSPLDLQLIIADKNLTDKYNYIPLLGKLPIEYRKEILGTSTEQESLIKEYNERNVQQKSDKPKTLKPVKVKKPKIKPLTKQIEDLVKVSETLKTSRRIKAEGKLVFGIPGDTKEITALNKTRNELKKKPLFGKEKQIDYNDLKSELENGGIDEKRRAILAILLAEASIAKKATPDIAALKEARRLFLLSADNKEELGINDETFSGLKKMVEGQVKELNKDLKLNKEQRNIVKLHFVLNKPETMDTKDQALFNQLKNKSKKDLVKLGIVSGEKTWRQRILEMKDKARTVLRGK